MSDLQERVKASVHYVIARTDPAMLGATKLNKILWYSDLEHYRRYGESITRLQHYTRMPQGPMSKAIERAVQILKKEQAIAERSTKVIDYTRREFLWLKQPNLTGFTVEQIDLLNQMIAWIAPMTADEISRITHDDALWKELTDNEIMLIGAASVVAVAPTQKQLDWAFRQTKL